MRWRMKTRKRMWTGISRKRGGRERGVMSPDWNAGLGVGWFISVGWRGIGVIAFFRA